MPPDVKKYRKPYSEEVFELIKFNFSKLDGSDLSRAAEELAEIDRNELELLLHPGRYVTKQGKRVQAAYFRAAPVVYKLTTAQEFRKWILLGSKTSELSFSCIEGFLKSSTIIIRKGGLPLLEKWTELGVLLAEKNNQLAIAYFNYTADAVILPDISTDISTDTSTGISTDTSTYISTDIHTYIYNDISTHISTSFSAGISADSSSDAFADTPTDYLIDFENFKELIHIGEKLAFSNAKVAEAYFKCLPDMLSLLSPENFRFFCSIIERLTIIQWTTAIDILAGMKDLFPAIPPQRRKQLLTSLNEFIDYVEYGGKAVLTLFKSTPAAMAKLNDRDFGIWVSIAKEIAKISTDAAIIFLDNSPDILAFLKITELREWSEKGIINLSSEKQALEKFFDSSFKGLGRHIKSVNSEERGYLLDIGVELAHVNPNCINNYFEYSPVAFSLFSDYKFEKWVEMGFGISKESSNSGSGYFKNSVASFRKMHPSYQGEIFKIAGLLIEKDWLLVDKFFENLPHVVEKIEYRDIKRWAGMGIKVYETDRNLAVDYFTYSPVLLDDLDVTELDEWVINGLRIFENNTLLGRPYFSLKSRSSKDFIDELAGGAALKKVANILGYYAVGLSGTGFKIRSKKELPMYDETGPINPVISGRTIYLEPRIKRYDNFEDNFKVYKLSVMHEVGHIQFSSSRFSSEILYELQKAINEKYGAEGTERNRLSTAGQCVEDPYAGESCAGNMIEVSTIISMFPNRALAASIFGILEDARVEHLIMDLYRGVRFDLENIRYQMLLERPVPEGDPERLLETLLWISTLHEPLFEIKGESRAFLDKTREILLNRVFQPNSSTLTSLEVTFIIYRMLDDLLSSLKHLEYRMIKNIEYRGVGPGSLDTDPLIADSHENVIKRFIPEKGQDGIVKKERTQEDEKERTEGEKTKRKPAYAMDRNWKVLGSYRYDEWDYGINDYKSDWCIVNEIEPAGGSGEYYTDASEHYSKEIMLIKSIFSRMRPEPFQKLRGQTDGTEIDIDAYSESLVERRCGINPEGKFYVRWDKPRRDVSTLFLIDVSFSTRKKLGGTGRSILDIEKDALVIMIQALESIGDKYGIYAFSGHTREDVEYYIIKEFDEEMSENVEKRIGLLEPVGNTRLGSAIRHSIKKLEQVSARTKILVLLSDGEPYDTCYGEGAYQGKLAEDDTKIAIQEGKSYGINFFCITVDTSPGDYLHKIFSDSGYTIIDDAQMLPERLPLLYKRITT